MNYAELTEDREIYIELNGKKLGAVEDISVKRLRETKLISAFGESEPMDAVSSEHGYSITLTRLCLSPDTDTKLKDGFSLAIIQGGRKTEYSDCRVVEREEILKAAKPTAVKLSILALSETESEAWI